VIAQAVRKENKNKNTTQYVMDTTMYKWPK
jgi:hypothetical protein